MEKAWKDFESSGKVADYLKYCNSKHEKEVCERQDERSSTERVYKKDY